MNHFAAFVLRIASAAVWTLGYRDAPAAGMKWHEINDVFKAIVKAADAYDCEAP